MVIHYPFGYLVPTYYLIISATAANQNIRTLLDADGYGGVAQNIVVTINSGVDIHSTSTVTPALVTGTIPAGSTLKLINNGDIRGAGGDGAPAGSSAGQGGGDALSITFDMVIANANGLIFGGGGGGSGSGGKGSAGTGSGGGGGAGRDVGTGGAGGTASGDAGSDGTFAAGGAAGANPVGATDGAGPGASTAFGAGGKAIAKNGFNVNIISGDTDARIKGDIS